MRDILFDKVLNLEVANKCDFERLYLVLTY